MECLRCGKPLDEYCLDCQEEMFEEAMGEAAAKEREKAKKYILVPKEELERLLELAQRISEDEIS
jgi:hypothetical protein